MSARVRVSVCLSVRDHIFVTTRPNLHQVFLRVTYGCGSVLLWRRNDMLRISGFMDDVIFPRKLRLFEVAAWLRQWGWHAALCLARRNTRCRQRTLGTTSCSQGLLGRRSAGCNTGGGVCSLQLPCSCWWCYGCVGTWQCRAAGWLIRVYVRRSPISRPACTTSAAPSRAYSRLDDLDTTRNIYTYNTHAHNHLFSIISPTLRLATLSNAATRSSVCRMPLARRQCI